jgi:hypothetical protein
MSGTTVQAAVAPADALTQEQRRAVWLEISAFLYMPSTKPGGSVWGTYFAPSMTATTKEGAEVNSPDITREDEATIAYWANRSDEAHHPILRARYADLVWTGEPSVPLRDRYFEPGVCARRQKDASSMPLL